MFTPEHYRAKAAEYTDLAKGTHSPAEMLEFEALGRSFTTLADNEQWLADNHDHTVHASHAEGAVDAGTTVEEEEHVLRCLGAALIMQWNTLPAKLQRELFDNAGAMGALLDTAALRGKVARFLHKHKNGEDRIIAPRVVRTRVSNRMLKMTANNDVRLDASQYARAITNWENEGGASKHDTTKSIPKRKVKAAGLSQDVENMQRPRAARSIVPVWPERQS
jgi:hypothetical protein